MTEGTTMTDSDVPEQYRSKTVEQSLAHLVEELSEANTAAAKSLRFGLGSVNPELPESEQEANIVWLVREMRDVLRAFREFDRLAAEDNHTIAGELIDRVLAP